MPGGCLSYPLRVLSQSALPVLTPQVAKVASNSALPVIPRSRPR